MVVQLASKKIPVGFQPSEFRYVGRPASEQGDFGPDVGVADLVPVQVRGAAPSSRYFHIGVIEAQGQWFVYMEWGWASRDRSWIGDSPRPTLDFMFARCRNEQDARRFFRRQCMTLNIGRIVRSRVGAESVWAAKTDAEGKPEDAWLVGAAPADARGLAGLRGEPELEQVEPLKLPRAIRPQLAVMRVANERPQSDARAEALVRGLLHDARIAARARGLEPTLEVLETVSAELLPVVMRRIAELSAPTANQPSPSWWVAAS